MQTPRFTLKTTGMIQANINNQTYFFTINHITQETNNKHIYGIRLNNLNYFLSKTSGVPDAVQLDTNPELDKKLLRELNSIITEIELKYKKRPTIELINGEIFNILARLRNPQLK
jgi:hypothetical protein